MLPARFPSRAPFVLALVLIFAVAKEAAALPLSLRCAGTNLVVRTPSAALGQTLCDIARDATRQLAACNMPLERDISLRIVDRTKGDWFGLYRCGEDAIEVLAPAAIALRRHEAAAFAFLPLDSYFASLIVHEMSHAAYDAVPCPYPSCAATSEYLAYAMQIASLSEAERRAFERAAITPDPVPRDRVNAITLMIAPDRFARLAWAHYSARPDSCAFVAEIMRGTAPFDVLPP